MSAFSQNRRRILSLWLPRLPIDRIKRLLSGDARAEHISCDALSYPSPRERKRVVGREDANEMSVRVGGAREEPPTLASASLRPSLPTASRGEGSNLYLTIPQNGSSDTPTIVIAKQNNAFQIFALDDAAARSGLAIGMTLANARAICPHVQVYDADEAADDHALNAIAEWCDRFTPLVALDSPHGLFLDITGCAHLFGGEAAMMQLLCGILTAQGFAVSAAIAGTAVCARTLTRHVHGRIVREGEEAEAVRALPVSALGADAAIVTGLRRAGLKTIGDVADRTRHEITARFGAPFTTLLEQALGQSDAPISPRKPLPDYIVEKRFAEPVLTEGVISATLSGLGRMLVAAMSQQGRGARRLEARFFRTDGIVRTILVDTGQPVTKGEVVDRLFRERLEALSDPLDPGFGFDLIRMCASRTEIVVQQQRDLDANVHDSDELTALIDRIAARIGGKRVVVHLPQDTHIPERAVRAAPAQYHLVAATHAAWPVRAVGEPPLRPLRLFERPEQIKVIAQVPDGPPARFVWRRATHAVIHAEGPERIAMEWWRAKGVMLTRDYFRVEDETGLRFWLYRDGLYETEIAQADGRAVQPNWFMHGLFA
jgi:protein ImuB